MQSDYLARLKEIQENPNEEEYQNVFSQFDSTGKGYLNVHDFSNLRFELGLKRKKFTYEDLFVSEDVDRIFFTYLQKRES
jgi:Ca2+-binding EF-hand superfamily protein